MEKISIIRAGDIQTIARLIGQKALEDHLIVQRYDALSTNSVYFKFDYGVIGSLRISDHPGRIQHCYKFNLQSDVAMHWEKKDREKGKFAMIAYAPLTQEGFNYICEQILANKKRFVDYYGDWSYRSIMERNHAYYRKSKGFWQKASYLNSRKDLF